MDVFTSLFVAFVIIKPVSLLLLWWWGGDQCVVVARIPLPVFEEEMGAVFPLGRQHFDPPYSAADWLTLINPTLTLTNKTPQG